MRLIKKIFNQQDPERWETIYIEGQPTDYMVSDRGRVINYRRERYLKVALGSTAKIPVVNLRFPDGSYRMRYIHRLMALVFKPSSQPNKTIVHFRNWIVTDNRLENLEWVSQKELASLYEQANPGFQSRRGIKGVAACKKRWGRTGARAIGRLTAADYRLAKRMVDRGEICPQAVSKSMGYCSSWFRMRTKYEAKKTNGRT